MLQKGREEGVQKDEKKDDGGHMGHKRYECPANPSPKELAEGGQHTLSC